MAVGLLTSTNRDKWADNYHILREAGDNANILDDIASAMFVLSLGISNKLMNRLHLSTEPNIS